MIRMLPNPAYALVPVLMALLMLAGCGQSSSPQAGPTASGEILPGTISDAMLETDRSQASAPLAPAAHSGTGRTDASATGSDAAADSDPAAEGAAAVEAPDTAPSIPKPVAP